MKIGSRDSGIELDHSERTAVRGYGKPAVFKPERISPIELSPPTSQRGYVGFVIASDRLNIVRRGNQLLCYAVLFAFELQKNFQQIAGRPNCSERRVLLIKLGKFGIG